MIPLATLADQPEPTLSGLTSFTVAAFICWTRSRPDRSKTATAWVSAGSSRSSASRQMANTPACGPSRRIWMAPGSDRSFREPSNTTMMSGVNCTGWWLLPADCCLPR